MPLIKIERTSNNPKIECDYCYADAVYAEIDHMHKTVEYLCEKHKENVKIKRSWKKWVKNY